MSSRAMLRRTLCIVAVIIGSTVGTVTTAAEQPPQDNSIHITADNAEFSRARGVSTYTGDVVLERGQMTLTGDKLVVTQPGENHFKAVLTGQPATLHRNAVPDSGPVDGHAQRIVYTSGNAQIVLHDKAVVKHDGDIIHGQMIQRDLNTGHTTARAADDGKHRVRITLHPDNDDQNGNQP